MHALLYASYPLPLRSGHRPHRTHPGKVRQQPSFGIIHSLYIRDHAECHTASDRAYHCIQPDACEIFTVGLCSDPMISKEHHRFLAIRMYNVYQLLRQRTYLDLLELYEIQELSAGNAEHAVVISLIHNVLRAEFVACPFLKLFQDIGAHTCAVSEPLYIFFTLLVIEGQCELMENVVKRTTSI